MHHHGGEDGQAFALPQGVHVGEGGVHNAEKWLGIVENATQHSNKVQEALEAEYIQAGDDIWKALNTSDAYSSQFNNKFEYIQALESNKGLEKRLSDWVKQYPSSAKELFELKQLEFSTRDARAIFESGKTTLDVFYETYQELKSHPEFSDYLSAKLPSTDSIMQKYSFLTLDTPIDVIEKVQLAEYKLQIAPKDNLVMFLFDKNANLYNVYDASSEMLPVLRAENDYALMISDAANLPSAEDMVSFFGRFSELSPLEQLQLREIVTKIGTLPSDVVPLANQQLLDILAARFTGEYVNGVPIEGMAEFLKI